MSIVVVDDDPIHRKLLERALRRKRPDVPVTTVGTLEEFERVVVGSVFSCAVIDYHLRGCRCEDILRVLREKQPDCPAIVTSVSEDQSVAIQCFKGGGSDFVPKSLAFEGTVLWERIELARASVSQEKVNRSEIQRQQRHLLKLARAVVRLYDHSTNESTAQLPLSSERTPSPPNSEESNSSIK